MRELGLVIGKKRVHSCVPESWLEVSERQFLAVVARAYDLMDDAAFYAQFFGFDVGLVSQLDLYSFYVLNGLLSFTKKDDGMQSFILPMLKLKDGEGRVFCVVEPHARLKGMSFQQFMMVDTFYTWYVQTKKRDYLLSMCACCYLREGEDFFALEMDERLACWRTCEDVLLYAVLVQWSFIKSWLSRSYPHLFVAGEPPHAGRSGGKVKVSNMWIEIFDTLVADDLNRIESYKRLECMDVLRIVNRKIHVQKNSFR